MAIKSDYISGTLSLSNGSKNFTGTGTGWSSAGFKEGDTIIDVTGATEYMGVIESITGETTGTLTKNWEGPTLSGVAYRMRYQPDGARSTAQARNLIEILGNGNITAFASLSGAANLLPLFTGPGAMTLVTKQSLVSGAAYNIQVANLAARAAYDGQDAGFAVLVSNIGDGRAAIYSKNSATSSDWSDAAYVTGEVGPPPEVEATVSQLPPGSPATVTEVPITGGVRLDFELPEADGFNFVPGGYDIGEAYDKDDVVTHNRSSFIALQSIPVGESPSSTFPPVDTAYWGVLVEAGQDGTGTGDVVGPSGAVDNRIAVFDGTTGKLIKDGGLTLAQLTPADGSVTNAKLANVPTATIKGRVAAGEGVPTDLTASQVLTLLKAAGAYAKDNILGTVAQSSGVPTGAIIETGSGASGTYTRFASGLQICINSVSTDAVTTAAGSWFQSSPTTWNFPAVFSELPRVQAGDNSSNQIIAAATSNSTSQADIRSLAYFSVASSRSVGVIAIGRWF